MQEQNENFEQLCNDLTYLHTVIERIIKFAKDNPEEQCKTDDIEELVLYIQSNLFNDDYPANKREGVMMLYHCITDDIPVRKFLFFQIFFQKVMSKITGEEYDDKNIANCFDHKDVRTAYFEILGIEAKNDVTKKFNQAIEEVKKEFDKELRNLNDTYNNKKQYHHSFK